MDEIQGALKRYLVKQCVTSNVPFRSIHLLDTAHKLACPSFRALSMDESPFAVVLSALLLWTVLPWKPSGPLARGGVG
jgi:hypothetical protein